MSKTIGLTFQNLTVAASAAGPYWGHTVASLQEDIEVANGAITGKLKYVSTGSLPTTWGPGNFIALAFSNPDSTATKHRVGIKPSQGAGMQELDSDMDAVIKVTSKTAQNLIVESTDGKRTHRQVIDLSQLVCEEA